MDAGLESLGAESVLDISRNKIAVDFFNSASDGVSLRSLLADEIAAAGKKSYLRLAVEGLTEFYHGRQGRLEDLKNLGLQSGLAANSIEPGPERTKQAVKAVAESRQAAQDAYSILGGALKASAFFMPGKLGYALSGGIFALDEFGPESDKRDLLHGLAKGLALKKTVAYMNSKQLSPAVQALALGTSYRFVDSGLSRQNFVDEQGKVSYETLKGGLFKVAATSFDPLSLSADLFTFGLARTMSKPLSGMFSRDARLSTIATSSIFGFSSGLQEEAARQWHNGELAVGRLALFPLSKGLAGGFAVYPAASKQLDLQRLSGNRQRTLDMEYKLVSVNARDITALARENGKAIELKLKEIGNNGASADARRFIVEGRSNGGFRIKDAENKKAGSMEGEELRFIGRSKANAEKNLPWQMQLGSVGETTISSLLSKPSSRMRTAFLFGGKLPSNPTIENLREPAVGVLGSGMQSVAIELANGGVFKLSKTPWNNEWGKRPFDARLLSDVTQVKANEAHGKTLSLYIQEPVSKASIWQYSKASQAMEKSGKYKFEDPKPAQVGRALRADGEHTVLIDYASVQARR